MFPSYYIYISRYIPLSTMGIFFKMKIVKFILHFQFLINKFVLCKNVILLYIIGYKNNYKHLIDLCITMYNITV